ncbi:MAG: hypothetical protein OER86_09830 [Phycisphaerae bacterium]|nr:hypothetical protein [Phycisphaerae bacterium]
MSFRHCIPVALVLASLLPSVMTRTARAVPPPPPPRPTTVGVVISALQKEARQSWKADRTWPRKTQDFAVEKNWSVPNDQIVQALTRRLNKNPAIDAYIKWQLLGFGVNLAELEDEKIRRIVATTPRPLGQPKVQIQIPRSGGGGVGMSFGSQFNYVADLDPVVGDGVALYKPRMASVNTGARLTEDDMRQMLVAAVRTANQRLREARVSINAINQSVLTYREALNRALPRRRGIRLGAMIQDVRDRAVAGDPSSGGALEKLVAASRELAVDPSITPQARAEMQAMARSLSTMRTPVMEGVRMAAGNRVAYDASFLTLEKQDVVEVMQQLAHARGL